MVVTVEELKRMEDADIRDLKREDLDNAGDIVIDRNKPANRRMREFLEQTKNPYAENVGDYQKAASFEVVKYEYMLKAPDRYGCRKYIVDRVQLTAKGREQ